MEASTTEFVPLSRGCWKENLDFCFTIGMRNNWGWFSSVEIAWRVLATNLWTSGTKEWNSTEYLRWKKQLSSDRLATLPLWKRSCLVGRVDHFELYQIWRIRIKHPLLRYDGNIPFWFNSTLVMTKPGIETQVLPVLIEWPAIFPASSAMYGFPWEV